MLGWLNRRDRKVAEVIAVPWVRWSGTWLGYGGATGDGVRGGAGGGVERGRARRSEWRESRRPARSLALRTRARARRRRVAATRRGFSALSRPRRVQGFELTKQLKR